MMGLVHLRMNLLLILCLSVWLQESLNPVERNNYVCFAVRSHAYRTCLGLWLHYYLNLARCHNLVYLAVNVLGF